MCRLTRRSLVPCCYSHPGERHPERCSEDPLNGRPWTYNSAFGLRSSNLVNRARHSPESQNLQLKVKNRDLGACTTTSTYCLHCSSFFG